jgi:hypothetical protein
MLVSPGRDLEGNGGGLILVTLRHLHGDIEENYSQDNLCPGRDLNRAPPGYNSQALALHQHGR